MILPRIFTIFSDSRASGGITERLSNHHPCVPLFLFFFFSFFSFFSFFGLNQRMFFFTLAYQHQSRSCMDTLSPVHGFFWIWKPFNTHWYTYAIRLATAPSGTTTLTILLKPGVNQFIGVPRVRAHWVQALPALLNKVSP